MADIERERTELRDDPECELDELSLVYEARWLDAALARRVTEGLMAHDALGAHARDELGISATMTARPVQAAFTSAATFAAGAALPLLAAALASGAVQVAVVAITALVVLAVLGAVGTQAGGAPVRAAAVRATFWGALAMAVTALIGTAFGAVV